MPSGHQVLQREDLAGPTEDSSTAILFVFIVDYSTEQLYRRLINSSFLLLYCLLLIRAAFQKMPGCIVNGCKSRSVKGDHNIIMHSFPRERDHIMAWLLATDTKLATKLMNWLTTFISLKRTIIGSAQPILKLLTIPLIQIQENRGSPPLPFLVFSLHGIYKFKLPRQLRLKS
ncbi:uncharacterized protein LOC130295874 isoform X3 [Hyla sarda]|uniref:uncharacterized protein LOC130295874 isoform X3 n=1 Tax=Hyla sarda TaxID=327740 RepID=UPI0024C31B6D|nr:uncharacterized protein LOC130295874 isoform X3 [Hyla sarda]